ncbi:MAG: DUF2141 domain-containing protein [Allomuricauda sp.]
MKILFLAIALMPFCLFSQNTILVNIHNVQSADGTINVAAYASDGTFLSTDGAIKGSSVPAHKGIVTLKIEDLPAGKYALAVFHDENGNGELDTNWLGIPKEKVAFSKGKAHMFGPPKYSECTFDVVSDYEIDIAF